MASQQEKFRKAAWAYVAYGVCYLGGALYLAAMGIAPRALRSGDWVWFAMGGVIVILFPWLLWRGFKWFARVLVFLMTYRAWEVGKITLAPRIETVVLPWGGIDSHKLSRGGVLPTDGGCCGHGGAGRLGFVR